MESPKKTISWESCQTDSTPLEIQELTDREVLTSLYETLRREVPFDNITSLLSYFEQENPKMPSIESLNRLVSLGYGANNIDLVRMLSSFLDKSGFNLKRVKIIRAAGGEGKHVALFLSDRLGTIYYCDPTYLPKPIPIPLDSNRYSFSFRPQDSDDSLVHTLHYICRDQHFSVRLRSGDQPQDIYLGSFDISSTSLTEEDLSAMYFEDVAWLRELLMIRWKEVAALDEWEEGKGGTKVGDSISISLNSNLTDEDLLSLKGFSERNKLVNPEEFVEGVRRLYINIMNLRRGQREVL